MAKDGNNGVIEAGPYQYKLGLYNADKGTRTYWFVGAKDIKLTPPVFSL